MWQIILQAFVSLSCLLAAAIIPEPPKEDVDWDEQELAALRAELASKVSYRR